MTTKKIQDISKQKEENLLDLCPNLTLPQAELLIRDFLTSGVIATWFMDDGSAKWKGHSNSVRFSTDSFTQEEISYLQRGLKDYGIDTTLQQKRKNQWTLATSEASKNALKEVFSDKILPEFYYKVPWMD